MPSPLEAKSEVTTGKHGDKGRYVTTDNGSQIFLTQDGKIGQTGKSIGGEMNWKPVGQPKPKQDWIEPGSRSGEQSESDLPGEGESGDAKPQYESPFVQSFAESIIANIRKHEQQKQQPKPAGPNPQDHEHHISKLPIPMRQSMLNWSAEAQTLINPVAWASQGSTFGSGDPRAVKKATFDKIDKAELNRVVGSLSKLISVGDQQGVNLRPFIRHNNIIPRELAAKLKPSDLFNPVQDNERYRADTSTLADQFTAILTERYAAISQSTLRNLAGKIDKPTEGQIESGNYRKGHVRLHGLDITIENAKGTRRRPEWPKLAAHYGYIKRTMGRDGDHVDVFIGPNLSSELIVVIDQVSQGGRFDEHKCLIGFDTTDEAIAVYRKCYTSDWKVGPITTMTIGQFKAWLKSGDQTKQISGQVSKYDVQSQADIVIDRMIAAEMGITVEEYAARRAKNSPGQMSLFGDGLGGDTPLRTSARQQRLDWDESKVKRDEEGKFSEKESRGQKTGEQFLLGKRAGDVKITAGRLFRKIKEEKYISIVGQKVSSMEELAELAQVYRDPRFETFRAFFVKDGKVIGHNAYTSREPGLVYIPENVANKISSNLQNLDADGFYILHNHPSGNPSPSPEDIALTKQFHKVFGDKLMGHTIINHNKGTTISPSGQVGTYDLKNEDLNSKEKAEVPSDILDETILGVSDLGKLAMKLRPENDRHVVILASVKGVVQVVFDVSDEAMKQKSHKIAGAIKRASRMTGSTKTFLIVPDKRSAEDYKHHVENGVFVDIATPDGKTIRAESDIVIKDRPVKPRVSETVNESGKYSVSIADLIADQFIASELRLTTEQYAARRAKNSPGQLGLFGDGIGGDEPLRTASRQQKLDWDESKVKRDDDGKFATSAGGEGAKAITKNEHGVHVITQDDIGAGGDGTFDQLHAGLASEIVQSKIAIGMKGIEGREYAIMQTKGGKWQLASRKAESGKEPTARERAQNRFKELNPDSKSTPAKPTGPEVLHEHTGPEGIVAKVTPSIHGYHVQAYKPNGEKFGGSRTVKRGDDAMEKAKKIAREISHPDNYLSDQEKTERELADNAADVAGDPKNARSRNLHRAIGYQNSLLRHYERKIQRGEGNEKQLKDFISGIESEIQWYESILKDRGDYAGGGPYSDESGFDSEGVAIPKPKKAAARDKPKFNFDQHVKIAADDISKLRKSDVYRLIETVPDTDTAKMVADMIGQKRPDLKDEAMSSLFDYLQDAPTPGKYSAALVDMIADLMIADELGLTVDQYAARKKSQKGQQELEWITVNADKGKGQPVMIDKKDGTIQAGMGGKFDGQKIGEIGKGGGANAGGGKDTSREKDDGDKYGDRLEAMKERRDPDKISQQPIDRAMRGDSGKIKLPKPESKTESQKPMKKVNLIFRDKRGNTEYHDLPVEKVVDPKMFGHKVEILPGGHVRLTYKGWGIMPSEFGGIIREEVEKHFYGKKADLDKGKYGEGFWRGTNNKNEKDLLETGQMRNSKNFADGTTEKGVSVAEHVGYGATQGYKYMHRIDGEVIGTGSDGEPVLDPKTIKVRKSFSGNSLSKLFKDDHAQLDRVLENEGWDRKLFTSTSSPKLLDASEFQKHVSDNDSDGGGSEVTDSPPNTGPKNAASPSPGSKPTPAPKPAENEPPTIPGQQTSLFGGDDLNTGQKSLFNMARPSKADQRAAKRDNAPPAASLLEQIDDEEKKRMDSRKSLPGQRDMFMAQFEAAMIEQYRVAVKPKADKPEKPKTVVGSKGDRGRFITTEGGDVVFLEGKMQPDGLIDTSKAVARKKREKAKHTNPDKFVPVTDEEKAIVQAVGDKKKDVAYFKQFVDEAHKEISGRLKSDTDAMRETLAQFGYTGTKASGFLSSLQRRRDTANIPGFDEMLDYVQKHYRQLLTARPGESTGAGDEESMLFNRLKAGFPPPPKKSDQEVIDAAWGMSGIDYSGLPSEWEGETREADDEVLHGEIDDDLEDAPFAASPLAVTERYAFTFATAFKNAYRRELVTSKIMEQYQVKHAPEGGETVGGKKYKGGQFVPGDANSEKNAGNQSDDWFNKSKIVDDHGKPLLLYHGNRGESDLGSGWVSFTDNENHAAMFGEVQQMHLKMENPFDITSLGSGGDPDSSETISGKNLSDAFAEHGIQIDFGGEKRKGFTTELMFPKKAEIREKLMSAGFDGIIVTDYFEFDAPEYIVFDESQIKVIPNDDGHDDDEDEYDS